MSIAAGAEKDALGAQKDGAEGDEARGVGAGGGGELC